MKPQKRKSLKWPISLGQMSKRTGCREEGDCSKNPTSFGRSWQSRLTIAIETVDSFPVRGVIPFQILKTGRHKRKKSQILHSNSPSRTAAAYANWKKKRALLRFILYSANKYCASVKCTCERMLVTQAYGEASDFLAFIVLLELSA